MLTVEAESQPVGLRRKRSQRDLEAPGACHHATDWHKHDNLFRRVTDLVGQPTRTVRPDGDSVATMHRRDRMREGPYDRMRDDESAEGLRRVEIKRFVDAAEMGSKQFVEGGVVPRLLIVSEPPVPVRPLGSQQRLSGALGTWSSRAREDRTGRA